MEDAISMKLNQAREYEAQKIKEQLNWEKPSFHITPPAGWMNDPNGFSKYLGEYHLFYQYHPYNTHWGPMHWGHSKTKDFIKWEFLPCALAPDTAYDGQGCFSGTAIQDGEKHVLMYTSVMEQEQKDGSKKTRQTQSIAVGDGLNYEKLSCNPVITSKLLPEGSSKVDFRDPKIWKENNVYYAVVGSQGKDDSGQLALFSSENLTDWKFESIIDCCNNQYGKMWECPDFFLLQGKQVLLISPQFMKAKGLEFHNGNNTAYFIGEFDKEEKRFVRGEGYAIDYGMDFYAPQTVETEDGRRVMIGWVQNWDNYITPGDAQWSGMMSIPRELSIVDNKLVQNPVKELEKYRKNKVLIPDYNFGSDSERVQFDGITGRNFDMTIELEVEELAQFHIRLAANEQYETKIIYNHEQNTLTTDRTYCGITKDVVCSRSMYVHQRGNKIKIRIIMDKFTLELFVNDGEQAMTSLIYTPLNAKEITFESVGNTRIKLEKYEIVI